MCCKRAMQIQYAAGMKNRGRKSRSSVNIDQLVPAQHQNKNWSLILEQGWNVPEERWNRRGGREKKIFIFPLKTKMEEEREAQLLFH